MTYLFYAAAAAAIITYIRGRIAKKHLESRNRQLLDLYQNSLVSSFAPVRLFSTARTYNAIEVHGHCATPSGANRSIVIKRFPYTPGDDESFAFASLLAEELIEKLLEK